MKTMKFGIIGCGLMGREFASATLYMLPALFVYLFFQDDIDSAIQLVDVK